MPQASQQQPFDHGRTTFDDRPTTPTSPTPLQSAYTTPPSNRQSKHASVLPFAGEELTWSTMSRPESAASDRISVVSGPTQHFPSNPLDVNPAPAYVAPAGAVQVLSEHRSIITGARLSDDEDDGSPSKDDITFAEPALALVNQFLDQLLYSFLSSARSTSMAALRPAVTDVLKHRLAREAIGSAEEELAELLAGGDEEEDSDKIHRAAEGDRRWDLELVWKRTRLRVMVYIRLGELEDEDEQRYVRQEELFYGSERRFSSTSGLVSWAAAIFLTSVLEYVAEQTLQVAGSAAHTRVRRQTRYEGAPQSAASNVVVEEHDVEKVALNSTLGRLWRTWRKSLRNHANSGVATPTADHSPRIPTSRENMYSAMSTRRRGSSGTTQDESVIAGSARPSIAGSAYPNDHAGQLRYPEHILAANIPLPITTGQRDVHEIEVPGLAADPDVDERLREILLSELAVAAHIPLPISKRDVHEIEVPGLARDVHDDDESQARHLERTMSAELPLPIKNERSDVDEIEVPGLASDPDAQEQTIAAAPVRRNSSIHPRSVWMPGGLPTPEQSQPSSPDKQGRGMVRRSSSVPTAARSPLPSDSAKIPVLTPTEDVPSAKIQASDQLPRQSSERSSVYSRADRDNKEQQEEEEHTGLIAGAAAGAAAAGTAIAAALFGSKKEENPADEVAADTHKEQEADLAKSSKTAAEIEELDKRKSLIDIKAIAGLQSSSPQPPSGRETPEVADAKRVTVRESGASPSVVRTDADEKGRESMESYTLGYRQAPQEGNASEEISSEEGPGDAEAIGVAQTADVPFTSPSMATPSAAVQDAREKQRPTRIIVGEETPESPTVKQVRNSTDAAGRPRSFSRKSEVSLTDQNRYVAQQLAQQRGIPGSAQQSPSSTRQLRSASIEQSNGTHPVQEHPAVQRMASLKRNKPVTDDDGNMLTSASIRGPEDFDMFVQGSETMKYTLTPEAVRGEATRQQTPPEAHVGAENELPAFPANSNAQALQSLEAGSGRDSREGRSRSTKQATSTAEDEERRKRQHRRSISRPATTNTRRHSKTGMMAREPRVQTESTRDFADFIRSTGPDKDKDSSVYPLMKNVSTTSLDSLRSAHINGASASRSSSPAASRTHSLRNGVGDENVPPVPPVPDIPATTTRGAMQPRGANGVSAGNSDLIDFIRTGPAEKDKHRISRSVAPFRSTMDSEQFRDMDASLSHDPPADFGSNTHSSQTVSQRTSANSRSALLNNGNTGAATAHPAYSGKPQTLSSPPVQPPQTSQPSHTPSALEHEQPRKRYRNKDPYAIDLSDEEDDDLVSALPRSGGRKEESLFDFLNSQEPPKDNGKPEPLIDPNSAQAKKLIQNAKANGMNSTTRSLHGDGRTRSVQNNTGPRPGYASSVNSARSGAGRPQPTGTQFISTSIPAGKAPRPKMVARATDTAQQSSTNDLASFLRDSGPPEDLESAPAPSVGRAKAGAKPEKEKKRGLSFFGSKKKKKTYLDMP